MGSLEAMLEDARANAATLAQPQAAVDDLLSQAAAQREAAWLALRELVVQRNQLATTLDEIQRELAVAGVPLRGEIT